MKKKLILLIPVVLISINFIINQNHAAPLAGLTSNNTQSMSNTHEVTTNNTVASDKNSVSSNLTTKKTSSETKKGLPILFTETYEDGQRAFLHSSRNHHSVFNQVEGINPKAKALFSNDDLSDLATLAISDLNNPQSHLYFELIQVICSEYSYHRASTSTNPSANANFRDDLLRDNKNLSENDLNFYQGVLEAKHITREKRKYECQAAADITNSLSAEIQEYFKDVYQASSLDEFWKKHKNDKQAFQAFSELTGVSKSASTQLLENHQQVQKTKNEQKIQSSYNDFVDQAISNPHLYLNSIRCSKHNDCSNHIGNHKYQQFITRGAFLGDSGTFNQYMSFLSDQKRTIERLAWFKYKKKLARTGCQSNRIISQDINLSLSISSIEKDMTPQQIQSANEHYHSLVELHLANAQMVLEC